MLPKKIFPISLGRGERAQLQMGSTEVSWLLPTALNAQSLVGIECTPLMLIPVEDHLHILNGLSGNPNVSNPKLHRTFLPKEEYEFRFCLFDLQLPVGVPSLEREQVALQRNCFAIRTYTSCWQSFKYFRNQNRPLVVSFMRYYTDKVLFVE